MLPKRLLGSAITLIVTAHSVILPAMIILEPQAVRPIPVVKSTTGNKTRIALTTPADKKTPQPPTSAPKQAQNQPAEVQTPNSAPAPSVPNNTVASTHYTVNDQTTQARATTNRQNSPAPAMNLSAYQHEMLVRIISAEAKGEPLEGQVAVGAVILNRIKSDKFPDTVAANVLKRGEFEPVANGQIWSRPVQSAYRAAQLALNGWDPSYGALYFYNPAKTTSRWIWSRPIITQIGDHVFAG